MPGVWRQPGAGALPQVLLVAGDLDGSAAPVALALRPRHPPDAVAAIARAALRLTLVLDAVVESAEALFSFNAEAVVENDAAEWLSRFKACVEQPMRLLAASSPSLAAVSLL